MRLLVFSDTHRDLQPVRRAIRQAGPADLLLHAGDHYSDALALREQAGMPVSGVVGNCDWGLAEPTEEVLEVAGVRILLTHGHLYGVKTGLNQLRRRACEMGAAMVIFGHTHVPQSVVLDGLQLFNPGSVSRPRTGRGGSYGIIEVEKSRWQAHIRFLSGE